MTTSKSSAGPTTLNALLERAATTAHGGLEVGLRFVDRRERERWLGWDALHGQALEVAGGLVSLGVERGERVALIYATGEDFFRAFFGILLAGAVPVPLYPPVRLGRLDEYHRRTAAMIRAAGAVLVLAEGRVRRILGPTIQGARPRHGCRSLDGLDLHAPDATPTVDATDLGLVQFSSGTTVDPKPVALSHRAILAQVLALNSFWPDDTSTRHSGVSWLPLYHDMGLIGCVFPALERPSTLTLLGPELFVARPALWLRALSRHRATISVAPNFAYGLCVEKIRDDELDGVDLSHWRVALNGAEAVAPSVLRAFQERFAHWGFRPEALTPVYGLSEATLAVTFSDLRSGFRTAHFDRKALMRGEVRTLDEGLEMASVGKPLPGTDIDIVDPDGRSLGDGRIGEVTVRGPSVMDGYLDRPDATAATLNNGWLATGDLGFIHDGELFLTSRKKDVVILRGRNYSPVEIEQAVEGVEGLRKGCAVAVSHLPEGADHEELIVFLEHRHDASPAIIESMPRMCSEAILATTQLRTQRIYVLAPGTLPRTSSGKLRRRKALELYLTGELAPPRKVTPLLLAGAMVRSAMAYRKAATKVGK